ETCSVTLFSTPSPAEEPTMWRPLTIRPVIGVAPIFVAVTCQVHGTPDAHEAEVALVTTRRPFFSLGLSGGSAGAAPAVPSVAQFFTSVASPVGPGPKLRLRLGSEPLAGMGPGWVQLMAGPKT